MYYNDIPIVFYDGEYLMATELKDNMYYETFHYGYGNFEGLRSYDTSDGARIYKCQQGYSRMKTGCEATGKSFKFQNNQLPEISYLLPEKTALRTLTGDYWLSVSLILNSSARN